MAAFGNFVEFIGSVIKKGVFAAFSSLVSTAPTDPTTTDATAKSVVWMGLDDDKFTLWKLTPRFLGKWFGPMAVVTDPNIVHSILQLKKLVDYNGNFSTQKIAKHIGTDNIFAATDEHTRINLRTVLMERFQNRDETRTTALRVVSRNTTFWLGDTFELNKWCSDYVTTVLLELLGATPIDHKTKDNLISAIDIIRKRLNSKAPTGNIQKYVRTAKCILGLHSIYPEEAENTLVLLIVGHPNLTSALVSLIYHAIKTPEMFRGGSIVGSDGYRTVMDNYPPVWLQARKVGDVPLDIDGTTFPRNTLILIPGANQHRQSPFSIGPNRCAARFIAEPIIEAVVGKFLSGYRTDGALVPKGEVALKFKKVMVSVCA